MRGLLGPKSILLFQVLSTWNLTRVVACTGAVAGNLHALADTKRVNHMANRRSRNAWPGTIRHALRLLGPGGLRGPHGEVEMGHLAERLDGGRFQLIWTASIHGVLGDLGCGFANTRALRVWLRTACFYFTGGWKVVKDSCQICRKEVLRTLQRCDVDMQKLSQENHFQHSHGLDTQTTNQSF